MKLVWITWAMFHGITNSGTMSKPTVLMNGSNFYMVGDATCRHYYYENSLLVCYDKNKVFKVKQKPINKVMAKAFLTKNFKIKLVDDHTGDTCSNNYFEDGYC